MVAICPQHHCSLLPSMQALREVVRRGAASARNNFRFPGMTAVAELSAGSPWSLLIPARTLALFNVRSRRGSADLVKKADERPRADGCAALSITNPARCFGVD
jgi:hypothetical protein